MSVFSRGMHKILKKTAFGRQLEKNYDIAYGNSKKMMPSVINNPDAYYDTLRGKVGDRKDQASNAEAMAKTVYVRTMVGPELNFMLAGVPFLVFAAIGTIKAEIREGNAAKKAKQNAAAAPRPGTGPKVTNFGKFDKAPLTSAPYSANFVQVRQELINFGMNSMTARDIVEGKYEGKDLESWLDERDLEALVAFLAKYSNLG